MCGKRRFLTSRRKATKTKRHASAVRPAGSDVTDCLRRGAGLRSLAPWKLSVSHSGCCQNLDWRNLMKLVIHNYICIYDVIIITMISLLQR